MADVGRGLKRILIEGLGWTLVVVGIAALVLPGPGLLALFAGLALLATQYDWAEKRLAPVRVRALQTAADSVSSWGRIAVSLFGVVFLTAAGFFWGLGPEAPTWWPVADRFWLMGGWSAGATMIASALIALATIVYSYKNYRGEEGRRRLERAQRKTAEDSGYTDFDAHDAGADRPADPVEDRAS
ncbi:PGPGW domain-containing protein [Nocardioidaceae bacterium]|nr:PGPGW domain-containing protein [Nocardioidaceae bacterium]